MDEEVAALEIILGAATQIWDLKYALMAVFHVSLVFMREKISILPFD